MINFILLLQLSSLYTHLGMLKGIIFHIFYNFGIFFCVEDPYYFGDGFKTCPTKVTELVFSWIYVSNLN